MTKNEEGSAFNLLLLQRFAKESNEKQKLAKSFGEGFAARTRFASSPRPPLCSHQPSGVSRGLAVL
jgi:hypothetical protein